LGGKADLSQSLIFLLFAVIELVLFNTPVSQKEHRLCSTGNNRPPAAPFQYESLRKRRVIRNRPKPLGRAGQPKPPFVSALL
jgi:hypothetical protein